MSKKMLIEVSDEFHELLTNLAKARRRSLHSQVVFMLENQISHGMKQAEEDQHRLEKALADLDAKIAPMS